MMETVEVRMNTCDSFFINFHKRCCNFSAGYRLVLMYASAFVLTKEGKGGKKTKSRFMPLVADAFSALAFVLNESTLDCLSYL